MTTTSEKILETIKQRHLTPDPRWKFLAKNQVLWFTFGVAIIIGALSFGVIIDMLVNHDWDIYKYLHKSFAQYVLLSLPYLWIVCVAIFSGLAYYNFVHTKGWYHHRVYLVVLASVFSSVALGTVFYFLGMGNKIDKVLSESIPYYNMMKIDKKQLWCHPDEGLLGGETTQIVSSNEVVITDCMGKKWAVETGSDQIVDSSSASSANPENETITVGERIKVIGEEKNSDTFVAKEVRDWDTKKVMKKKQDMKKGDVCSASEENCGGESSEE